VNPLDYLDPDVRKKAELLLDKAATHGIKLRITQGFRSMHEQQRIYDQGRTTPGQVVTHSPPGYSWHEFGRAFDICIVTYQGDTTPKDVYDGPWELIGDLGESLGLEWGGRWKNPDQPHFQDHGALTLAGCRAAREAGKNLA
jgi:peptidoglycan L-alanyl-D-glutamate endopeptidase CwlK